MSAEDPHTHLLLLWHDSTGHAMQCHNTLELQEHAVAG